MGVFGWWLVWLERWLFGDEGLYTFGLGIYTALWLFASRFSLGCCEMTSASGYAMVDIVVVS